MVLWCPSQRCYSFMIVVGLIQCSKASQCEPASVAPRVRDQRATLMIHLWVVSCHVTCLSDHLAWPSNHFSIYSTHARGLSWVSCWPALLLIYSIARSATPAQLGRGLSHGSSLPPVETIGIITDAWWFVRSLVGLVYICRTWADRQHTP